MFRVTEKYWTLVSVVYIQRIVNCKKRASIINIDNNAESLTVNEVITSVTIISCISETSVLNRTCIPEETISSGLKKPS